MHRSIVALALLASGAPVAAQEPAPLSGDSEVCLSCHEGIQPGLVADWRASRHARVTPAMALGRPVLERRFSATDVPAENRESAVGCYECHGLRTDQHRDHFEHYGYTINVVVSPDDCRTCHPIEAEQFAGSKKAHAVDNLRLNPLFDSLVRTAGRGRELTPEGPSPVPASPHTQSQTCYSCHGTVVEVTGRRTIEREGDTVEVPELSGWPNMGVGRINPDGSRGACTACHPRHSFDIAVARQPHTCSQCHLEPDVPAWEVYRESKHGNLALSSGASYDWTAVPWQVGRDFRAPSCATCHNALLTDADGRPIVERTHDFGARLWVRLFGLPTSHPQPLSGATHTLRNADGQPLPVTLDGRGAEGLIDAAEQARRRETMTRVCASCHSRRWAENHFSDLDTTVAEVDRMVLAATQRVRQAWERRLADPANLFDEPIEIRWVSQWLFHASTTKLAAAMMAPDYRTFKHGWWELNRNLAEMEQWLAGHAPAGGE